MRGELPTLNSRRRWSTFPIPATRRPAHVWRADPISPRYAWRARPDSREHSRRRVALVPRTSFGICSALGRLFLIQDVDDSTSIPSTLGAPPNIWPEAEHCLMWSFRR